MTDKVVTISWETGYSLISRETAERESDQSPALPAKLVRQPPVRIDTLMTKEQFRKLVRHMLNDNPVSHFLQVWRDEEKEDPAQFAMAGPRKNADTHASWAWDTITGKAQVKTGLGLYPKNRENKSTWGAMDFDAHSGNDELAKGHATRAFTLLLEYRDRSVILSASGRGYHVFILANEPRPVAEWTSVLKDVAASLQLEVKDGQCELFPGENTLKNPVGKAIRVPGTYNPTTDSVEMIMADSIDPLLDSLTAEPPKPPLLSLTSNSVSPKQLVRDKEVNNSSDEQGTSKREKRQGKPLKRERKLESTKIRAFLSPTTDGLINDTIEKFPITAKGTRHGILLKLAGNLFHKFGWQLAELIVREHYHRNRNNVTTPLSEHLRKFGEIWESLLKSNLAQLSQAERAIYDKLNTPPQQEAFLLIRDFAHLANGKDFQVGQYSLADRLGLTQQGVACVIERLIDLRIIRKVADARINSRPALYRWIANH